jgi:predicted HNH restriction endonuclease
MGRIEYSDALRDPRWLKLRLFKLQTVGWKCERCGATDLPFHVHHPKYKPGAAPWEYWITELEALCENCHAEIHGKRETDPLVAVVYQAMADAHRRWDWDNERAFAVEGMELLERGHFYRGLV